MIPLRDNVPTRTFPVVTVAIIVVNAIETPKMREDSPGTQNPTFTPAEDLADAIAFLCSESAARMNGQRLSLHP